MKCKFHSNRLVRHKMSFLQLCYSSYQPFMIHIKAYPPRILYQSPYRSAQISDLADIHLTFRFQAALPVIVSPAQRSSKTGRRAQSEIIFQAILPRFYFGKFLTKLQIWHEFHSHFFCFLSLYDTTGTVVLILSVLAL